MADEFVIEIVYDNDETEEWTIKADGTVDWGSEPKHNPVDGLLELLNLGKLTSSWLNNMSAKKFEVTKKPEEP